MSSVLYDAAGPRARRRTVIGTVVGSLLIAALLAVALLRLAENDQLDPDKYAPFVEEPELYGLLWRGLQATLLAAGYGLLFASVLGMVLGVGRLSSRAWVRVPAVAVIEFFRGIPLLLLIFFFFLGFPVLFGISLPALWALVFGLTLYNGSVIAEIIRAGVLSLPRGQTEAALAIGLRRGQAMRLVLLPQAIRLMLPALISQLVVLLKDTSLGFIVGYPELLRQTGRAVQVLDNPLQLYAFAALIYIVVNSMLSLLANYVDTRQRAKYGARAVPAGPEMEQGGGT